MGLNSQRESLEIVQVLYLFNYYSNTYDDERIKEEWWDLTQPEAQKTSGKGDVRDGPGPTGTEEGEACSGGR